MDITPGDALDHCCQRVQQDTCGHHAVASVTRYYGIRRVLRTDPRAGFGSSVLLTGWRCSRTEWARYKPVLSRKEASSNPSVMERK